MLSPEVILTNFFAEPTVLLVPITSREVRLFIIMAASFIYNLIKLVLGPHGW
jgi:hypothetical protein